MANYTFNANNVKTQTIKLKKNSNNNITITGDVGGQVVTQELDGKLAIIIYKKMVTGYTYTKTVEKYTDNGSNYKVTTTKYTWNGTDWQQTGGSSTRTTTTKPDKVDLNTKQYQIEYTMQTSRSGGFTTSLSIFAAESPNAKDDLYKSMKIDRYGSTNTYVTDMIKAKIYIENGDKANTLNLTSHDIDRELLSAVYVPERKGKNKYVGTYLNEIIYSTSANETFDLKTGDDTVAFSFYNGTTKMGKNVINLTKNENLTIKMLQATSNIGVTPDETADILINTDYKKQGNDLLMLYKTEEGKSLGQTTIKNYFKVAQDNIILQYSGAVDSAVDNEFFLTDILADVEGIGYLGDDTTKKAQTIKGNFLDNTIMGGKGDDTIKGVAGDNIIIAGKGSDKIYCGKGSDIFCVNEGEATGKGDYIYNANEYDSLYFFDGTTYQLTKKANNLIVKQGSDKVTLVDYFKNTKNLLNINDDDVTNAVIYQKGKSDQASTFTDTKYNDNIQGGNLNDIYNIKNGGNDLVTDAKGNDTYKVKKFSNTLNIKDMAGKDKLIVSDTKAHSLYFDVTVSGSDLSAVGKNLQIFDKTLITGNSIVGGVTIQDYIAEYTAGNTVAKGKGCIEKIQIDGMNIKIDVNKIANSVAGWLADKGYVSSMYVFENHTDDISEMLNVYTTGTYQP